MTPWLAAGAGIVVAAGLALNVPRTVLTYSPTVPPACQPPACSTAAPGRQHGGLAATEPGIKLQHAGRGHARQPAAAGAAAADPANPHPRRAAQRPRAQVDVLYQTIQRWPTGFTGLITVVSQASLGHWRLAFRYPGAHIDSVTGARWVARGDGGVATAVPWPWGRLAGVMVRIMIIANGSAGQPTGCRFDGARCSFG